MNRVSGTDIRVSEYESDGVTETEKNSKYEYLNLKSHLRRVSTQSGTSSKDKRLNERNRLKEPDKRNKPNEPDKQEYQVIRGVGTH